MALAELDAGNLRIPDSDLKGFTLASIDFSGAILDHSVLDYARLEFADLSQASLAEVSLQSAHLLEADLTFANLSGSDLRYSNLLRVQLGFTDLSQSNLSFGDLRSAQVSDTNFSQARLVFTDFEKAKLNSSNLDYTWLLGADLRMVDLRGAFLRGAILDAGTDSIQAFLSEELRNAPALPFVDVGHNSLDPETYLKTAVVELTRLVRGEDREDYPFSVSNYDRLIDYYRGARLEGADLRGADLSDALVSQAQLNEVCGDSLTVIPKSLRRPSHWLERPRQRNDPSRSGCPVERENERNQFPGGDHSQEISIGRLGLDER